MKKVLFSLVAMLLLTVSGIAQTTFTKVTSASGLEVGANYLIVAHDDDLGVLAMGYQKSNNRQAVVVDENGDAITVTLGTDPNSETDVFQFTLGGSTGAWTLFDEVKGGYLYAASSSGNQLKTQTTLDSNGEWSITFNADGTAEVVAQGENTRNNMRFNPNTQNGSPLFSCYAETSTIDTRVSFYKAGGEPTPPKPEPSNYPTNFTATVDGTDVILTWTDAVGEVLPDRYLIRVSTGNITTPDDHIVYSGEPTVGFGVETYTFSGLQANTTYHFAIFPYTNPSDPDYKTNGTYPSVNATTEEIYVLLYEDFEEDLGVFTAYDAYGDQSWHQATYQNNSYANMNGYASGASHQNEDWLIAYVDLMGVTYNEIWVEFSTAMKYEGDPLKVMVSSDYDGQSEPHDSFYWEDLTDAFVFSTGEYQWTYSGKVDIAGMIPNYPCSFYLAFLYTSNDEAASSWEVDNVKVTGTHVNAINETATSVVSLYPNPAREQVSFVLDNDAQVSIFDMTGRKVNELNAEAGQMQLNVSELESGVYFLNVRYVNGTTAVTKFVKF